MSFEMDDIQTCPGCGNDKPKWLSNCVSCLPIDAPYPAYMKNKGLRRKHETEKLMGEIKGAVVLARLAAKSGDINAILLARQVVSNKVDPQAAIVDMLLTPAAGYQVWSLYSYLQEKLEGNFSKRKLP